MARVLVLGSGGLLGQQVVARAVDSGHRVEARTHADLDLADQERVGGLIGSFDPELLINCAAFTDVDACESRPEEAYEINAHSVGRLAEIVDAECGGLLLHVSTDYVFDGESETPYREGDPTGPRTVYGRSKLLGEQLIARHRAVSVRTSWLFGPTGRSFVSSIIEKAAGGQDLRVVADQLGCPTYAPYLARALIEIGELWLGDRSCVPPVLHYRNSGPATWHELATRVVELLFEPDRRVLVTPVTTAEFPRPAPRPAYSVLAVESFERLAGRSVEPWLEGLREATPLLARRANSSAPEPAQKDRGRADRRRSLRVEEHR